MGFSGLEKVAASTLTLASHPTWGDVNHPLWIYALNDTQMGSGQQGPSGYQFIPAEIDEDFSVWGEGIRQARVRVRSIRHVLFRL